MLVVVARIVNALTEVSKAGQVHSACAYTTFKGMCSTVYFVLCDAINLHNTVGCIVLLVI
jgi:hypothetical protein